MMVITAMMVMSVDCSQMIEMATMRMTVIMTMQTKAMMVMTVTMVSSWLVSRWVVLIFDYFGSRR